MHEDIVLGVYAIFFSYASFAPFTGPCRVVPPEERACLVKCMTIVDGLGVFRRLAYAINVRGVENTRLPGTERARRK